MAQICDIIMVNDTITPENSKVCQGIAYNSDEKIAWFKGQQANTSVPRSHLCYSISITSWLLNAGESTQQVH